MTPNDDQVPLFQHLGGALAGERSDFSEFPDEEVVAAAMAHGIVPLLRERMEAGTAVGLSTRCRQHFDRIIQSLVAMELLFDESTRHLTTLLADAGYDHLFLKGTALGNLHYDWPWHRPRSDIDFWIRESEANAIEDVLTKAEYRVVNLDRNPLTSRQFQAERITFQDVPIWFDIHLKPSNRALFYNALDFETCLEEAQRFGAGNAPALSDRHLLLHSSLHRIAHERNTEKNRLIWLWDIHRLFEAQAPEGRTAMVEAATDARLGAVCADALSTCRALFGTAVTNEQLQTLMANPEEPSADLVDSGRWAWMFSDVRHQGSWGDRASYVSELVANQLRKVRGHGGAG